MTTDAPFRVFLADCQATILNEIATPEATRRMIAQTYRMTIDAVAHNGEVVDWKVINEAIVERWSPSGREWIKEQAWSGKCFQEPKPRKK